MSDPRQPGSSRPTDRPRPEDDLDALLFFLSHELTAPVWGLVEFGRLLEAGHGKALDAEGRELLQRIAGSANRLQAQIRDMAAYARLVRTEPVLRPCSLEAVVDRALERTRREAESRGARRRVDRPLPLVLADEAALVPAVEQLLANAMLFTAAGVPPSIWIGGEEREGAVRLVVEDNGIGVAPEHRERIFRLFERLHGNDAYPGTGIGLAIVRRAAAMLGGSCGVESASGGGSRFWVGLEPVPGGARRA